MAKKSQESQDFDLKFLQYLCIGCGKKYVKICKKRKFEKKGKQVLVEGVNCNLGYPHRIPQ